MTQLRLPLAIGALLLAALPGAALACDIPGRPDDPAAVALRAREIVERSVAIIDAEVIAPTGGDLTARLRPLRVLKGPALPVFLVHSPSDCHIFFLRAGDRMRIVLSGGPDPFTATQQDNGLDIIGSRGVRRLHEAMDASLGVPRPAGFVTPGH